MVNPLPAILIGGPPNVGKSVLTYNLTQALRRRNIPHYVLRANPDGEGDWSQELDREEDVRHILIKGHWTDEFIRRICADLEGRPLPLLVDLGGLPTEKEGCVFRACTHAVLLLHPDNQETAQLWRHLVAHLKPLAELYSDRSDVSTLTSYEPVIKGTLTGLERRKAVDGPVFEALVTCIGELFNLYVPTDLEKMHLAMAPAGAELVNLRTWLQTLAPGEHEWEPKMLPHLLAKLPTDKVLAIYGRGPNWLYAALSVYPGLQSFYQFSARLGWVVPPPLQISSQEVAEIRVLSSKREDATILNVNIVAKHLDYLQAEDLPFPPVPTEHGLILSGGIPQWLLTSLVRLYYAQGVSWIAIHYPRDYIAVIVCSQVLAYVPGSIIPMPITEMSPIVPY